LVVDVVGILCNKQIAILLFLLRQARIVNGKETGVNEFPMMAALIDFQLRDLFCGTTVIASRYCLSAAHCLLNRQIALTGVLIGDHDIYTGT
jgi:trypsin